MRSVIINAYAVCPGMGSEQGLGWNWIIEIAKFYKVHVITESEYKDKIELVLRTLAVRDNVKFYFIPVEEHVRIMCWNQGDWRFYYYYEKWQKKALEKAKSIIEDNKIDLLHQLNMIGFREPGYLWKIKDIPFIWGPIDAKETYPVDYMKFADVKSRMKVHLKNTITKMQLKSAMRVRAAINRASFVVAASSNSAVSLKKYFNIDLELINETGCYVRSSISTSKKTSGKFKILWVGKFDFRKQLPLALEVVSKLGFSDVELHIVGDDKNEAGCRYKQLAIDLGIADYCIWHGLVSHSMVQEIMRASDLFFFTSVAEGTPHVVLESISNCLPVLCFNTCGQGDTVNERVGLKIELSKPEQSVREFTHKIQFLYENRHVLKQLSENCFAYQGLLSWDKKALQMVELYNKALERVTI